MLTSTLVCFFVVGYIAASVDASEVSKCYSVASENYCFYTNGSMLSLNEAREFCESKNSTLPIIIDAETDSVFQRFFVDDSFNVIQNRSAWIDAYAREINNTHWRWITGRQSGLTSTDFHNNDDRLYWSAASVGIATGSIVLYQSSWNDNQHYVCQFDSQQSSSTTTSAQCSPYWIIYQGQGALGARKLTWATTQQLCLRGCEVDPSCTAAEWGTQACWLHYTDRYRDRSPRGGITQFEIVRGCQKSGGTVVMYNKFDVSASSPPDNDSDYSCAVAMASGQWRISRCHDRRLVVCQSDHLLPVSLELSTAAAETMISLSTTMTSEDSGFVLSLAIGLAVGLCVAVVAIVVLVVVVISLRRRTSSNGQVQDTREPTVSYAVSQKDTQPANDENYATLTTTTEENPHVYSQISPFYVNSRTTAPSGEQYETVPER